MEVYIEVKVMRLEETLKPWWKTQKGPVFSSPAESKKSNKISLMFAFHMEEDEILILLLIKQRFVNEVESRGVPE